MNYVGLDLHKKYSFVTVMDDQGIIKHHERLQNDKDRIVNFFSIRFPDSMVAMEATRNWYWMYDLLEDITVETKLAHPLKTRAIAEARVKTDKISSEILAHLLRTDLLPCSYIPSRETRDEREVLRYRASLVGIQTKIKNKIRALLSKYNIVLNTENTFTQYRKNLLDSVGLPPISQKVFRGYLVALEKLEQLIAKSEKIIDKIAKVDERAKIVDTHPGIGVYSALTITREIDDIERFRTSRKLRRYVGMTPSESSSGDKIRRGKITKEGNKFIRWIIIQCATTIVAHRKPEELYEFYSKLKRKKGHGKAIVALANRMLTNIYYMLKNKQTYDELMKYRKEILMVSQNGR